MFQRRAILFRDVLIACDIAILIVTFAAAYSARVSFFESDVSNSLWGTEQAWLLWGIIPTWIFFLHRFGLYDSRRLDTAPEMFSRLLKAELMSGLVLFSALQLGHNLAASRLVMLGFLVLSTVALFVERLLLVALAQRTGSKVIKRRHVLLVKSSRAPELLELLEKQPLWKNEIIGFLSLNGTTEGSYCGKPILGNLDSFPALAQRHVIDEVVAPSLGGSPELSRLASICIERGITFRGVMTLPPPQSAKPQVESLGDGNYLLSLETVRMDPVSMLVKRTIDVVGSMIGLAVMGIAYLWYRPRIRKESPGPVFFRQLRMGQNGRVFTLYKFRTMHLDAEARLAELRERNEMNGAVFKLRNDPRVLPSGESIRRRHLDELPQFWNVLRGEMSLVGTRPPTLDEVATYEARHHRRLSMRPGVTGMWQIQGNETVSNFEEIVKLDCDYINRWSIWLDLKILARTVVKVAGGAGW